MQKVASLIVDVKYIPFLKQGQRAKIFYKDLILNYKECFVCEGVRGPIYHDDPSLKKEVYHIPEIFAQAELFIFAKPENPDYQRYEMIKIIYDFSPLLYSKNGLKLLKEKALPSSAGYDIQTFRQKRRSVGLLNCFYLNLNTYFETDLLRALKLDNLYKNIPDSIPRNSPIKLTSHCIEQISTALKCCQFYPSKIEPEKDLSNKFGFLSFVEYKVISSKTSSVIQALGIVINSEQ